LSGLVHRDALIIDVLIEETPLARLFAEA